MPDDISKKVLIEIDLAQQDAQTAIQSLKVDVDALASSVKANKAAITESKAATAALTAELTKGKVEQQQVKIAIDKARLAQIEAKKATDDAKRSMQAASGSYAEAQKKLTELGKAIKNTEGGFTSTNSAIKAQIAEYNKLNSQLKAFDAQMGNYQRNVGNYEGALSGLTSQLGVLIPNFGQFQGILKDAAQNFNVMGSGAADAGEGMAVAAGAGTALSIALGSIVAVGAGAIAYFKDVSTFSDGLSNSWAGLKASWVEFMNQIRDGKLDLLGDSMDNASKKAKELNQSMIDLSREMLVSDVQTTKENQFIETQMLKMRNLHTTAKEAEEIFKQVQDTAQKQYERVSDEAQSGFIIVANKIALSAKLTSDELDELMKHGIAAANQFKEEGKHISDDLLKEFAAFQSKMDTAESLKDQIEQRAQNREEQRIARANAATDKAERLRAKEENDLLEAKRMSEQLVDERQQALFKILQDSQETFAKELSATDEHYRQLIFKQQQFIIEQEKLRNKTKSPAAKAQFTKNIAGAKALVGVYDKEHAADQQKLLEEHSKAVLAETQKAANDLAQLQISSLQDEQERDRQAENLQFKEKNEALDKEVAQLRQNQTRLNTEISKATGERKKILQKELSDTENLLDIAADKRVELQQQHDQKELDNIKKFEDQKQALKDQIDVIKATKPTLGGNKQLLDAEQKQLLDQYNAEVSQKGLTDEKKLELEAAYIKKRDQLNREYKKKQAEFELQATQQVENAAFTIIQQSLQHSFQAAQVMLDRQKNYELQNKSLTETQKYIVSEKFRVKEGQLKVKQFKQEQELAIAKAIVDGGLAVVKTMSEVGWPAAIPFIALTAAVTALEVATIAKQKPPAYAKGGVHYESDGRGGVLPGYSKTDNMNARLRSGEGIVVSEAMRDPWAKNVVSAINQAYGGRPFDSTIPLPHFAAGGVFTNYIPTGDNGLRPQININQGNTRLHPDDINGIARAVASMPTPIIDIKDVNYQQGRLAQATDRLTY